MLKAFYQYITADTARAYQALQVFRLGSVILFSIVLVQLNMDSERIGDFEWFIFLANVSSFFWGQGLKNAFMSFYPSLDLDSKERFIYSLGCLFLLLGVLAFGIVYWMDLSRMDSLYIYLPSMFCFIVLGTTASLSEHILILKQKSLELFYYGFISYTIYLLGLTLIVFYYRSIQPIFIGLAIWACLRFIYFVWLLLKYAKLKIDFRLTSKFLVFGMPLIAHVLLGGGMEYVDGYLVETYFERSDFTYFRYGARELPINTIFISAMASAFIPLAVINLSDSLSKIRERTSKLMNFLFPISMILMVASPYVFSFVYSDEYLISAQIFNIYLLIICSRMLLPQIAIYARQKNSILMWVSIIEFGINIGLSLILMKNYGLYGIAFATVIAYFVQKIILIIYNSYVLNIQMSDYIHTTKYIFYTIALYAVFCFSTFFLN